MGHYSKNKKQLNFLLVLLSVICCLSAVTCYLLSEPVFASIMGSDSYRIQSDSVNIGGRRQISDTYYSEDSAGEVASGISESASYKLKAGYQEMQEVYISLTSPGNIAMDNLSITQNTSIGTGDAWTVITDDPAGYTLTFQTDNASCLSNPGTGEVFTDYSEATSGTPETWSVGSGAYEFGFSVYGNDVSTATWGTDTSCGIGSVPSTNLKYEGFKGVTAITVANTSSRTSPTGTDTVLCVAAEQKNVYAPSGNYTADITATATAL